MLKGIMGMVGIALVFLGCIMLGEPDINIKQAAVPLIAGAILLYGAGRKERMK